MESDILEKLNEIKTELEEIKKTSSSYVTPRQFAEEAGIGYKTALDIFRMPALPVAHIGRQQFILREELERYFKRRRV